MNILLVEDDAILADRLVYSLNQSEYSVTCTKTGAYVSGDPVLLTETKNKHCKQQQCVLNSQPLSTMDY